MSGAGGVRLRGGRRVLSLAAWLEALRAGG